LGLAQRYPIKQCLTCTCNCILSFFSAATIFLQHLLLFLLMVKLLMCTLLNNWDRPFIKIILFEFYDRSLKLWTATIYQQYPAWIPNPAKLNTNFCNNLWPATPFWTTAPRVVVVLRLDCNYFFSDKNAKQVFVRLYIHIEPIIYNFSQTL